MHRRLNSICPRSGSWSLPSKVRIQSGLCSVQGDQQRHPGSSCSTGNVLPYEFILPPSWKQQRVANILSGNYCQPKCAEPWVEVKFEDPKEGSLQVVAAPLVRLTNKPKASIEEIGDPETVISALGPFVTGNSYDPDEVVETFVENRDGETFYCYRLETPYAKTGAHNLAAATSKGSVVLLFVVSANDSQWSSSESLLRTVLDSFKA